MKNYSEFKQEILKKIRDYLPEKYQDAELSIHDVVKNNGEKKSGLILKIPDMAIIPTLYLEPYYERYKDGVPISELVRHLVETYIRAIEQDHIPQNADKIVSKLTDWNKAKGHIYPKIVNYKANEEKLQGCPYTRIADLAVLYYLDLTNLAPKSEDFSRATAVISNELFAQYKNISIEDLHAQSIQNLIKNRPTKVQDIMEVLSSLMPGFESTGVEPAAPVANLDNYRGSEMLVLSNETKVFSAANLLDTKTMDALSDLFKQGFYILPSSIHEVLIVPHHEGLELAALRQMVCEVNSTLEPSEILSDNVYSYDELTKSIYIADDKIKEAVLQFQSGLCLYVKESDEGFHYSFYDNNGVMLDHGIIDPEGIDDIKDAIDKALEEYPSLSASQGWSVPVDVFKEQIKALQKARETAVI